MMRKPQDQLASGLRQLNLPSQLVGDIQIEITGQSQVLLCGQRGIRSYGEEAIIVDMGECGVCVTGGQLRIVTMSGRELLVRGNIQKVEFLP